MKVSLERLKVTEGPQRRTIPYVAGTTDAGREFSSLVVIGAKELTNVFVRLISNLFCRDEVNNMMLQLLV